ncbi:MAG TPA: DoxX family protein [Leptospiraceae bacterium]|jgi:hypothetical protein|nr:DoxX family protein [Leptospirales bacterium]HMW61900.1 DoxX family protein [Leptospiraceae bacterium]HMY44903.1 DoxX family protein [Leptospiraceae bacterium]HNE23566.1 DoxX family protein [Leptospiraceae bacterium]HNJ03174.1 DoxX family protein [Leptospiraceae bacterium]
MLSNTVLWSLQGVLCFVFLAAGLLKMLRTREQIMNGGGEWAVNVSARNIRIIGVLEIAAAIGIILPLYFNVMPVLTFFAAVGMIFTMIVAGSLHFKRGEMALLLVTVATGFFAALVAFGRRGLLGL